ncbi:uncharacterized protein LOC122247728 [Penaeus japonicus]|uniref:uncharacterized protein LOC122247728 n=1 Tax=Penaeus japonicus TaxID=27405 RepID=UPI001C715465|nr:uncharacterized protein LOC122247728 [Penaeus japonicus]
MCWFSLRILFGSTLLVFSVLANPSETDMTCLKEGRYPHPRLCGGYVECVANEGKRGASFAFRQGRCIKGAYDPSSSGCVTRNESDGCRPWQRRGRLLKRDETYDFVCPEGRNGFFCAGCKTLIQCIDGKAYPERCRPGDYCDLRLDFGGAVCYPNHPANCTCQRANTFRADLYREGDYFYCREANEEPEMRRCPEGEIFDVDTSRCRNSHNLPDCTTIGVFANPANCTQYYTCVYNTNGWVRRLHSCNNSTHTGLMYNERTAKCEDPCKWRDFAFTCQKEGRFPDPFDCQRYFECVLDANGTAFRQIHHACPDEYTWNPNGFGMCVGEDSNADCAAVLPVSKCVVPEGHCGNSSFRRSRTQVAEENGTISTQARIQDLRITIKVLKPDEPCHPAFTKVSKECIHLSADMLPWDEAQKTCSYIGGNLATPRDVVALRDYINAISDAKYLWLGGTDAPDEGNWRWLWGGAVNSSMWAPGKPDGGGVQNCLLLSTARSPPLDDYFCSSAFYYVCQYY